MKSRGMLVQYIIGAETHEEACAVYDKIRADILDEYLKIIRDCFGPGGQERPIDGIAAAMVFDRRACGK